MFASDFRRIAREALRGKWIKTALILLLAGLLGASVGVQTTPFMNFDFDIDEIRADVESIAPDFGAYWDYFAVFSAVMLAISLLVLLVGSLVRIGMFRMGDGILDGRSPRAGMLFPGGVYKKAVILCLLRTLYVSLWALLFVIPGIIAAYRYSMAEYLLSRNPDISPRNAINASKAYMKGNKGRLFGLELSFIGWAFLCSVPASIGLSVMAGMVSFGGVSIIAASAPVLIGGLLSFAASMLLNAYMHVAMCAFFRSLYEPQAYAGEERREFNWSEEEQEEEGDEIPFLRDPTPIENEPAAKELFFAHGCSRMRMRKSGVLEQYEGYRVDPSSESRWVQDHGSVLMQRFAGDPLVLDELLGLISEYAMDDLLDRVIERIARHVRQETLPGRELMNMLGRVLALAVSGAFADRGSYVRRKQDQISAIADRLEQSLALSDPDGDWQKALELIRQMCM